MRFVVDHCVPRSIGEILESEGHEVIRLSARLRVDAEDSAVIEEAQKIGAILLSLNGDFADLLRYPPEEYGGIVALQVRNRPEAIPAIRRVARIFGATSRSVALHREAAPRRSASHSHSERHITPDRDDGGLMPPAIEVR